MTNDNQDLNATLRGWQVPPASPWLAGRIAAGVIAAQGINQGRENRAGWSLFPGPLKMRVAALTLAVVVGWGVGAFVSAPEAAADDGSELAEILW